MASLALLAWAFDFEKLPPYSKTFLFLFYVLADFKPNLFIL